jgi:mono/diheme cytochrome c family protein
MLALTNAAGIVILILGVIAVVIGGGTLILRGRTKREGPPAIPATMQPGPSDEALETPLLQKLQGWGVILVAFFVIWIPLTWLREPSQNLQQDRDLKTAAIERGSHVVEPYTEENQGGYNCVRCHGAELRGGVIAAGVTPTGEVNYAYPPNLTTVCGGPFTGHLLIKSLADIYTTIEEGRNVMPSWSIKFNGPMDDQQINDVVNYLVYLSSKNVPYNENVCINPDAVTAAASPNPSPPPATPTPSGSASAGASGSPSSGGSGSGSSGSATPSPSASGS